MSTIKTVTTNGDSVSFQITVNGSQFDPCPNAKVVFDIPNGVSLTGPSDAGSTVINVPKGYYNIASTTWFIGDLAVAEQVVNTFEFTVDDIDLKDPDDNRFLITLTLSSACTETNSVNNVTVPIIEVVDECTNVTLGIGISSDTDTSGTADLSIG